MWGSEFLRILDSENKIMNNLNPSRKMAARPRAGCFLALFMLSGMPAALILLMLVLVGGATASAQVVTNSADSGPGTLRSAITNADSGAVITFDPNLSGAIITLSNTLTINTNLTIDASALSGGLQINGNNAVTVFNVASNTFVFLNSLTITNGYSTNNGGGIYNGGTLTLTNCILSGNGATNGGVAVSVGGAGGGIFNFEGTLTLNQCTLSGNSATWGGGIYIFRGTFTLNQCTLSGNSATNGGGGINNYHEGTLTMNQCTLSGNDAAVLGGGVYNEGKLAMTNTIVAGNIGGYGADGSYGADIYNDGGALIYGGSNLVQSVYSSASFTGPAPLTKAPDLAPLGNYGGSTQTMPPLPGSPAIGAGSVAANTFSTDQRGYARTQNGLIDIGAVESLSLPPFTASPINGTAPLSVQFNSTNFDSDGSAITGWNWSFGDGTTGTGQNPSHIYSTLGIFSPSLIVTNSLGLTLAVSGPSITALPLLVTNSADSGPGTLRSAIINAASGVVITFDPNLSGATITLSNTLTINTNLTIDASALPGGLQINGNGSVQIFNVAYNTFVFLNSLTITNAYSTNYGGGILNYGTLTLTNCTVSGNSATNFGGGGIGNYFGDTLTLINCTLSGNSGGAIDNSGTLTLTNCTLSGNSATAGGGGIDNGEGCTATLNQCTLSGNSAYSYTGEYTSGGIFNSGTLTLNQCTLSGNSATNGGGIYNRGGIYNSDDIITLNQCTLSGNSATFNGGGILNDLNGKLTLNQCTLSGNSAPKGGGIYNNDSWLAVNQCTLSGNSAPLSGGGIFNFGTLAMTNTIVAGNTAGSGADIGRALGLLTYGGSNLVQSVYGSASFAGPAPLTNAPDLAPLGNYGGPTQTMPPLPGSPAIGAGSVAANTFSTDQRGYPRTQNGLIDLGAVELQSPAANPPVLGNITVPAGGGNGLQFTFTNAPAADFTVLTATNVSLALTNWTVLGEVRQVAPGQYQFTDPQAATNRARFYRVRSP
jgi:PKD repeat protein